MIQRICTNRSDLKVYASSVLKITSMIGENFLRLCEEHVAWVEMAKKYANLQMQTLLQIWQLWCGKQLIEVEEKSAARSWGKISSRTPS